VRRARTIPGDGEPQRLPYGCLVALLPLGLLVLLIAASIFGETSLDPPPAHLVPELPDDAIVQCEATEEGTAGFERKEAAAADATRILLVSSRAGSTQDLIDDIAAAFQHEGWDLVQFDLGGGWHEASLYEDQYFATIWTYRASDIFPAPCDLRIQPAEGELVEVIIGDHPWD
jgi:hypothetical protein